MPHSLYQAKKEEVYEALLLQKVDIVLTAHPTEVNRRTLLRKYREISECLAQLDKKDLSPYEKSQCEEGLRREISSIWGSDEIRREKPTPQFEAKGESLMDSVMHIVVALSLLISPSFLLSIYYFSFLSSCFHIILPIFSLTRQCDENTFNSVE